MAINEYLAEELVAERAAKGKVWPVFFAKLFYYIKADRHVFDRLEEAIPALVDNYFNMKEKGLLVVEQPDDFLLKSWSCTA